MRLQSRLQFHLKSSPPILARHDFYSGHHVIAEYRTVGQSTTLVKYVYGPGIDRPVMMVLDDGEEETKYYFHQDRLGSIIALSDESGDIVEGYTYDAFGSVTVNLTAGTDGNWLTPDGSTASHSQVGNPYYFTGRRLDPETGLYYYRARYYHPTLGRFLQADPIGYAGGLNLYGYCGNNAANYRDPFGLFFAPGFSPLASPDDGNGLRDRPHSPPKPGDVPSWLPCASGFPGMFDATEQGEVPKGKPEKQPSPPLSTQWEEAPHDEDAEDEAFWEGFWEGAGWGNDEFADNVVGGLYDHLGWTDTSRRLGAGAKISARIGSTAAQLAAGAGIARAVGLIDDVAQGNNVFRIIIKPLKVGFRIDKAHHGKGLHTHFWKW